MSDGLLSHFEKLIREKSDFKDVKYELKKVRGDPREKIVEYVDKFKIDTCVVGSSGMSDRKW